MLYSYPSYLGVPIFKQMKGYMPSFVLGMTNGREIKISNNLPKDVADFVLMHEEEHVKNMLATEKEVDERALRRFLAKNGIVTKNVKKLMRRRHGINENIEKHFSLKTKKMGDVKEKNISDNFISYLYSDPNW